MAAIWTHLTRIIVLDKGLVSPVANCAFVLSAFYIALKSRRVATAVTAANAVFQCCYVLLCTLAFENSTAWLAYLNLAAMTTMPLFTLSSSGYFFFQAVNFFNIYHVLNEIDAGSIQQIVCICLHAYLSYSHLDLQTRRVLQNMKDLLLYTKELQLLKLSWIRKIGKDDLGQLPKHMRLGTLINEFKYDVNEPMFLIRAIIRMVWKPLIPLHMLGTFFVLLYSLGLLVRRQILDILDASAINWSRLYLSIVMEFGIDILKSQAPHVESYIENETNRVGKALEFELFRLPLTRIGYYKKKFDLPYHDENLISNSIAGIQKILTLLPGVVTNVVLLYMQVGWFVLTPLVVKVILIGISGVITLLGYPRDKYSLTFDDEYVSMNTNEIYHNIRSIKMFGWERMYLDPKLDVYARSDDRKEDNSRYAQLARAIWFIYKLIEGVFSELSTGISIYLYCKYGKGASIFSNGDVYNIFNILSSLNNQLTNIKHYFNNAQEGIGYVNKMEKLLISKPINTLPNSVDKDVDPIITIDDGEFKWNSKTSAAKNVSFTAKPGDLVAVVGKTASGKSSLLYSLCSEVEMSNGTGIVNGSVAYVEQSPWIMSGTLRDNILFGREFDEKHYNDVIYACAFNTDIKEWEDRDLTMLGERGINISGGQKTRLALARALYSRADIYILDDPLSAIDAHVKRHILDHVIMSTGMLKDKIRIVSSNDNKIIPYFNTVLTVNDGCVTTSSQPAKKYQLSSPSPMHKGYIHNTDNINADTLNQQLKKKTSTTTTTTSKTSSNIMYIFKLCGVPIIASFVLLILLDLIGKHIMDNLRLNTLNANSDSTNIESNGVALKLIYIEMAKQLASSVSNVISNKLDNSVTSKIKHRIKDIFERSLVYAPLSFYDRKLRQQITADKYQARNLASEIIEFISRVTSSYISSAFALYNICINRPQLLIVIPFVVTIEITKNVILRPLQTFLDKFKSDAHVEGDKISDVIADGEHLIRIYGVGKHFTEKYIANIDEKLSVKLPTSNIHDFQRFIYYILHDTVSTMCNLCVVLMSSYNGKRLTSGDYISYRYLVDDFSYYLSDLTEIPRYFEKITKGVSLLREYTDAEQETLFDDSALNPEGVWPTKGKVEFKDFSMKYREDLEYSLKNISLTINSGEKVGIVGRTGAGKSSITRVLFRLVNSNLCNGSITIDGYDINKMDLGYLRPRLGIIPQDPTLFDSSFKKNFDPLEEYSIEDIWAGVVKCDLAEHVQPKRDPEDSSDDETWEDYQNRNIQKNIDKWNKEYKDGTWPYKMFMLLFLTKPKLIQHDDSYTWKVKHGLDAFAFMNSDYSNGQKQIISLCRLVIRQHKLIVLDEATSSVDLDTDQEMHNLIRSEFKDSTVLTIAHRLETIMKSDRIVVMDKGQIAEVGTPAELLQANGLFSELVKANDFGE